VSPVPPEPTTFGWTFGSVPPDDVRDRIEVRGLRVEAVHGVLESERARPQPFEMDLDLYLDMDAATQTDDLAQTADYGRAVDAAVAVLRGPSRRLLESLAGAVADAVLDDQRVDEVAVTVRKLRPPLPHDVVSTGVRVRRRRTADSG
jgi:7,8-dihydroneopterin aldolase/epimerase/oxygenase